MFPSEGKGLFCHKGCKFTFQGVDQTLRRPLAVLLFRNCCKRNCISKDNGQFQKAKLRLRRLFSLQPKVQHYSTPASLRVTRSRGQVGAWLYTVYHLIPPTSKTTSRFWNRGARPSRRSAFGSALCKTPLKRRFGTAVRSQVGEWLLSYAWFCYADIKNDKSFLEL